MTAWQWENSLSVCRDSPLSGGFCIYLWVSVRRVCNAAQRERRERWRDKEGESKAERGSAACRERGIESREATRWGGWGGRMRIRSRQRGREGIRRTQRQKMREDEKKRERMRTARHGQGDMKREDEYEYEWYRERVERSPAEGQGQRRACRVILLLPFIRVYPPTNIPTSVLSCYCR